MFVSCGLWMFKSRPTFASTVPPDTSAPRRFVSRPLVIDSVSLAAIVVSRFVTLFAITDDVYDVLTTARKRPNF